MSRFRNQERFRRRYLSKEGRRRRAMVSIRIQDATDGQGRAELVGRAAGDGTRDADSGERFSPVGFCSRPASDSVVESLVLHVGGNPDHPVEANTLDRRRLVIIDAVGLGIDETVVYTSKGAIKIDQDGVTHVGPVEQFGKFDALVTRREFNAGMAAIRANNAAILNHAHPVPSFGTSGLPIVPPPSPRPPGYQDGPPTMIDPDDAEGTQYLEAK